MGRPPLFGQAMTGAERKARWKERHAFKWPGQDPAELESLKAWERSAFDEPKRTAKIIPLRSKG